MVVQPLLCILLLATIGTPLAAPKAEGRSGSETNDPYLTSPPTNGPKPSILSPYIIRNVRRILDYHLPGGRGYHEVYDWLAEFVDTLGHRKAGTRDYLRAADYIVEQLKRDSHTKVTREEVKIPLWVRGTDKAFITEPLRKSLKILALGSSVPTPPEGLHAEVAVAYNHTHLTNTVCSNAMGKILLFDQTWVDYPTSVEYRNNGAKYAAACGAVAVLVKSVTSLSVDSPHTGAQTYDAVLKKIPAVSVTVEDADIIARLIERGSKVKVKLSVESHTLQSSHPYVQKDPNVIAELTGSEKPEQIILIGAHLDSWDVGQGAMDNGGGVALVRQALHVLETLNISPRRTIRGVFFASEESGFHGSGEYYKRHKNENIIFTTESDSGAFGPQGYEFTGTERQTKSIAAVMPLFRVINATRLESNNWRGIDTQHWIKDGIAGGTIDVRHLHDYYFTFHHSEGDTMSIFKRDGSLERAAALQLAIAYIVADMDEARFPW